MAKVPERYVCLVINQKIKADKEPQDHEVVLNCFKQVLTLGEGLPKYTDTAALALIIGHEVRQDN